MRLLGYCHVALGVAVSGSELAVESARLTPDMPFLGMAYGEFLMVMLAETTVPGQPA